MPSHRPPVLLRPGRYPAIEAALAIDGIDEFLDNLPQARRFAPQVAELTGSGEGLLVRCTDTDTAWTITLARTGSRGTTPTARPA